MATPRVLIGIPAFRGTHFIRETLESISNQDYRDFRALISVDDNDSETAAACAPFLGDARFSIVMQDRRLGWDGNINWLMSQPDYDFFCYWQQDDFTSSNYLFELLRNSTVRQSAVCYFSDLQWIGLSTHKTIHEFVTGIALDRVMSIFEKLNGIPLRGLIRHDAIDRAGPIRRTEYESAFEEFVWVAKLAREGILHRVEGPIYFKRAHHESAHGKLFSKDRLWRRAAWLEFGLGMLDVIWPLVPEKERVTAFAVVLDRLCIPKDGRFLFYDGPPIPFASDFLSKARNQFPIPSLEEANSNMLGKSPFAGGVAGELLDRAIGWSIRRPVESMHQQSKFRFCLGESGIDLLLAGWSFAEKWGIWSDAPIARLRLPIGAKRGMWKALITFRAFGKERAVVPVDVTLGPTSQTTAWLVPANQIVRKELTVESDSADITLQLAFPNAASPFELGSSGDRRRLGIGLITLDLTQPA